MPQRPPTSRHHRELPIDQVFALRHAAERLEREFGGVAAEDTIEGLLHASYDHVADHATVEHYLPLLAERYTREWLQAAAETA